MLTRWLVQKEEKLVGFGNENTLKLRMNLCAEASINGDFAKRVSGRKEYVRPVRGGCLKMRIILNMCEH